MFIFPFTVHNLSEDDVKEERRKIKRLATKTQYGQGSCYYNSKLILERLSPDEISKWQTQNSTSSESGISDENQNKEASSENRTDFKLLAQELNVKNVKVSLPRISPSKFILDRDSTSPSSSYVDDESTSDNEVTINNKDTIPSSVQIPILKNGGKKRRSRSSSPSSVSTYVLITCFHEF